ncbi:MAG: aldehyde:ferredoxin oxidoreductase, partial [Proteobacteria bacterium]|nr:aldehyde:ferredoxin oxidoreductase [Pseudomonadota bacterium]
MTRLPGYYGLLLDVDLSTGKAEKREIPQKDLHDYIGGRGLGVKLLWDALPRPGIDALSPENPLFFMAGPFSGFPLPSSSRTCVVTK